MKTTIIFCHYGNSPYLKYVFKCARESNPNSRIVLIGDNENRKVALKNNLEHYDFNSFGRTKEIIEFNKVYQHIAGKEHGKKFWTNFVFKRWFFIHEFIQMEKIEQFWHFDSDNLIFVDLQKEEFKFNDYDNTEQCGGICINGYINSFTVVDRYVKKINELFLDENYLGKQLINFEKHPQYAFTEMRAYETFKESEKTKTIRLNKINKNESFDDCICFTEGYEVYEKPIKNQTIKKLYQDEKGRLYCKQVETGSFIRMNSLNMSWVPMYLYEIVTKITNKPKKIQKEMKLIDVYSIPYSFRIKEKFNRIKEIFFNY